jgi:chromosome segregation ATPase
MDWELASARSGKAAPMGTRLAIFAAAFLLAGGIASAQEQQTSQTAQQTGQSSQGSVADAARKAREQKKSDAAPAKTFTNDNVANIKGDVSTVGNEPEAKKADDEKAGTEPKPAEAKKDEKYWRKRFADLRQKIADTEKEIDVLQRELEVAQKQYYPDPNVALQQQYSREDINKKTKAIDDKKQELSGLNQQLSDLQDELRKSGGDPGWSR